MATLHTNKDGLSQWFGPRSTSDFPVSRRNNDAGAVQTLIVDFDYTMIGLTTSTWFDEDSTGGSTPDRPSELQASLPANAWIKSATLIVKSAFTSGGAATMTIGTYLKSGVAIDADGIDAAIAIAAIDTVGETVLCDGAQVAGTATIGTADAYFAIIAGTAVYTAGSARLAIEYLHSASK